MSYPLRIHTVSIEAPLDRVTSFLADPRNFPAWAAGLSSTLAPGASASGVEKNHWVVETPAGRITIRFSAPNLFGVADHWVRLPDGTVVYVPLRAVANGEGTEVSLTLFRLPQMDDARFEADSAAVEQDLAALRQCFSTAQHGASGPRPIPVPHPR